METPEQVAAAIEGYLAASPAAVVFESGKVLCDLRQGRCSVTTEHGWCMLHLWGVEGNAVRRVTATELRGGSLRLTTMRFGQTKPQVLEVDGRRERRTQSSRELTRERYVKTLERTLEGAFPGWRVEGMRTAMDLEKSFGPAYARGLMARGQVAWAVIGVSAEETTATVDGILTLGILWLAECRAKGDGRRVMAGLRVVVPGEMGRLTGSRMAWLNERVAGWELWELSQGGLSRLELGDGGNLGTRLRHAPNLEAARERFAGAAAEVMDLLPDGMRGEVEHRIRSGTEMAFLLHGLEFARVRMRGGTGSLQPVVETTFGTDETVRTAENEATLREYLRELFRRRHAGGDRRDLLFRMQPERWLEGAVLRNPGAVDGRLGGGAVYAQVPAFSAADRGMMDLLTVTEEGRLAVLELKAEEDLHLAFQGLDYWIRVRWHHQQRTQGLGEFQEHGYFPGVRLSDREPLLFFVAPGLRVHPAVEAVLRVLSPRVEWMLVGLDERWRSEVKVVWRKRSARVGDGDGPAQVPV